MVGTHGQVRIMDYDGPILIGPQIGDARATRLDACQGKAICCEPLAKETGYGASALTKFRPSGVPSPVTSSHPDLTVSDESVPKVITNQRVEKGLLYNALK